MKKFTPTFEWDTFNSNTCWTYTDLKTSNRYWIFYNHNDNNGKDRYNMEIEIGYNYRNLYRKILLRGIKTWDKAAELAEQITNYTDSIEIDKENFLSPTEMRGL